MIDIYYFIELLKQLLGRGGPTEQVGTGDTPGPVPAPVPVTISLFFLSVPNPGSSVGEGPSIGGGIYCAYLLIIVCIY